MKKALLVIDFINGIVRDGSCKAWANEHPIVGNTNKLIDAARKRGIEIFFVRLAFDKNYTGCPKHSKMFNYVKSQGMFQLGNEDTDFIDALDFHADHDTVINKLGANPFAGNNLEQLLKENDIEHLIFTGVATENAIDIGVRYANDQGFYTTIVTDACGAANKDLQTPILLALERIANELIDTKTCLEQMSAN